MQSNRGARVWGVTGTAEVQRKGQLGSVLMMMKEQKEGTEQQGKRREERVVEGGRR